MSDENKNASEDANNGSGEQNETSTTDNGSEELKKQVESLATKLESQSVLITKLREHEKTSLKDADNEKQKREGVEGEFDTYKQELDTAFEERFRAVAVDAAVETALLKADVHNVDTAKKLIDRDGIELVDGKANLVKIEELINSLQESDSYLFKQKDDGNTQRVTPPTPIRPGEGKKITSGIQAELKSAKSTKEIQKILRKYEQ